MKENKRVHGYEYNGDISVLDGVGALCTFSSGMLHLDFPDGVFSLLRKLNLYGLTRDQFGSFFYSGRTASVVQRFNLVDGGLRDLEQLIDIRKFNEGKASKIGLHAIDFIGDDLYIMDTYNNRCLVARMVESLNELRVMRVIYPRGKSSFHGTSYTKNGYHGHFNTVYRSGDFTYMIAHNNTLKTNVNSELYAFNSFTMQLEGIVPNIGSAAHDMVVDTSGNMYICDSGNHSVKAFDGEKFETVWRDSECKSFVRGLAMNDDINVIGGSFRTDSKTEHMQHPLHAMLFVTDKNFNTLCTIKILNFGQVHQIRFTGLDYGYSNTWRKHED